jgi:methyl-accepting chemotaxis protein
MTKAPLSLESCRVLAGLGVLAALALPAAHLLGLSAPGPLLLILAALVFIAGLALLAGLSGLAGAMRDLKDAAASILAEKYGAVFPRSASGLTGEMQETLAAMVDKMKRDLSLARGIMRSMVTPCAVSDDKENFIFGNAALVRMVEHDGRPEDFYGGNIALFFYGEVRPTVLGVAMKENRSISKEVVFTGRKGRALDIHIDSSPLFDLEGKLMGALCVYTDLSEARAREVLITRQKETIAQAMEAISSVSQELHATAGRLMEQVRQASGNACTQAERAMGTAHSMEEMNTAVAEVARGAATASAQAGEAQEKATDGARIVDQVVASIGDAGGQTRTLKENLHGLGGQISSIGKVMDVISDIADQTNLLALNAAIEAARAGDAGRGFAVVADEVRKLAEKTVGATKEVGSAIAAIQADTRTTLEGMDRAAEAVERASTLAGESGQALREIVGLVGRTTDTITAIASVAEEQSQASTEIARSVDDVHASCDETSKEMAEAEMAVQDINRLSDALRQIVLDSRK